MATEISHVVSNFSTIRPLPFIALVFGFYAIASAVYRIIKNVYFHPLSRFPGPFWARATSWWSTYQQVVARRSMHHICEKLHSKHGDIIRIGPNRLHFNHPSMYDEVYCRKWDKDPFMYSLLGGDGSTITFVKHQDNKNRKNVLHPFFSKSSVANMQWLIQQNIEKFCTILEKHSRRGISSDLYLGFRCLTLEMITSTCFGQPAMCFENEDFDSPVLEALDSVVSLFMAFKHLATFRRMILRIPEWLGLRLFPKGAALAQMRNMFNDQIDKLSADPDAPDLPSHPIMYRSLLDPACHKGRGVPSRASLLEEAVTLVIAGTDTTGTTTTIGTYHICNNPSIYHKLKAELQQVWPNIRDRPRVEVLEKLPFLVGKEFLFDKITSPKTTACIKEALRLAPTTTSENSRVVQEQGATIGGEKIPGNTIVSMGVLYPMKHPDAFVNPDQYIPERWLNLTEEEALKLNKYFVPFSKGPRSCLGINLAWAELYLIFANFFRRFEVTLDGTKLEDFDWIDVGLAVFYGPHLRCFCKPVEELSPPAHEVPLQEKGV